ncbi:hypothetical protein ACWGJP_06075 [Microbacterium sp. NPDC055903]
MDDRIADVLQSPRYASRAAESAMELAEVESGLGSDDPKVRIAAARRLSALTRAELSWLLLPIREYFLDARTLEVLAAVLRAETEVTVRDSLLNTLRHASERFVTHPMWDPLRAASDERIWYERLHPIAASFSEVSDASTRVEAAYLLAACGDGRAWDVFLQVIPRRSAALATLELAVLQYPQSIADEQRSALADLADTIGTKHPRQRYVADGIRAALSA